MSKTALLKFNPHNSKWEASYQGQVFLKSGSKDYVVEKIVNQVSEKAKSLGITAVQEEFAESPVTAAFAPEADPELYFGINERFEIVADLADMVATRTIPSVIVLGEGGLGKTHTILKALKAAGLSQVNLAEVAPVELDEDGEAISQNVDPDDERTKFIVVKGYSTAKAMFRTLYENRFKIVVFDDCDVLKDPTGVDILKGALDSYDDRVVTWGAEGFGDDGLPRSFSFEGGVIFITNKPMNKIPQPIISRSMVADVSMTRQECITRMGTIMEEGEFMPEYSMDHKREALAFIAKHADRREVRSISLRTLITVTKARVAKPQHWERLALYSMINSSN
jgi:hypothetical protein